MEIIHCSTVLPTACSNISCLSSSMHEIGMNSRGLARIKQGSIHARRAVSLTTQNGELLRKHSAPYSHVA